MIKSLFLAYFHPETGPTLRHQFPEGFLSPRTVSALSDFFIPKPTFCGKVQLM